MNGWEAIACSLLGLALGLQSAILWKFLGLARLIAHSVAALRKDMKWIESAIETALQQPRRSAAELPGPQLKTETLITVYGRPTSYRPGASRVEPEKLPAGPRL